MPMSESDLSDRAAISDLLVRCARAIDSRDWAQMSACFAPDLRFEFAGGAFDSYAAFESGVKVSLGRCASTQHLLGNTSVAIDGDTATAQSYCQAVHVMQSGDIQTVGVIYDDTLRRTPDGWRLATRRLTRLWGKGPTEPEGNLAVVGNPAERLVRLEAEQAVTRVLYRYARGIDTGDDAGLLDCFTADATWETRDAQTGEVASRISGRTELAAWAGTNARARDAKVKHVVAEPIVDVAGDTATASSYTLVLVAGPGGTPFPAAYARNDDRLVREADGGWRIASRKSELAAAAPERVTPAP